mgnify:CR=1 FL=1
MQIDQVVLREANLNEMSGWDELVKRFDNHRVFHTTDWIGSLEDSSKGRPLFLVYEKKGEIVGCLPGLLTRVGPIRVFGSPLPGWQTRSMGPAFDEKEITTTEMTALLIPFLEKQYGVHHIEIMSHTLDQEFMNDFGFRGEPRPVFRVPLYPGDEDRVLKNMKANARQKVKRGVKLGLITRFTYSENFVDEIYDQLVEVYARGGNTIPFNKQRVEAFFRHMKEAGDLLAIGVYLPDSDICIATGLFTVENKELILWAWTTRTKYRQYNPTELMTWTVMQKAMEMGCIVFQIGGGSDFKTKFGAYPDLSKIRWVRSRYKWLTGARDIAEKCYRWQQAVRGHLARRRISKKFSAVVNEDSEEQKTVQSETLHIFKQQGKKA